MIKEEDIKSMSVSERLKAIELIWESLSTSPEYIQSPDWHHEILRSREEKVSSGNATFLNMDEVRQRLKKKSDEKSHPS